jgi:hypothetical protein
MSFERNIEAPYKPEIMRQVLADAFLKEPDLASLYYPRTDKLLIALYNKTNQNSLDENGKKLPDTPDGSKEWRAAYRVVPDFQNWLKYFSSELVYEEAVENDQVEKTEGQTSSIQHPLYALDDEMLPDRLLDIDD